MGKPIGKPYGAELGGAGYVDTITDQFSNVRSSLSVSQRTNADVFVRSSTSTALPSVPIPPRVPSAATADTTTAPSRTTDLPARMAPWAVSPPSTVSTPRSNLWRVSQAACELCSVQCRTDAFILASPLQPTALLDFVSRISKEVRLPHRRRPSDLADDDPRADMLPLCKDQFGCRYLQKKLEDGNPEHRDMIFNEIFPHFAELMTDPFANYLSQRLLEYSTDEQRDALIESISGELVSISLNMHGTRAVQKMIDYLSTQRQVQSLILALNLNVVTLIKGAFSHHFSTRRERR